MSSPSVDSRFNFINDLVPRRGLGRGFENRDSKIIEGLPGGFTFYTQNSAYVGHFSRIAIPAENLTFPEVNQASRGLLIAI